LDQGFWGLIVQVIDFSFLSDIVGKFSPGDITLVSREALNREGEDSEDSGNSATYTNFIK
jgi:sensor domain CHASE-containing protein